MHILITVSLDYSMLVFLTENEVVIFPQFAIIDISIILKLNFSYVGKISVCFCAMS